MNFRKKPRNIWALSTSIARDARRLNSGLKARNLIAWAGASNASAGPGLPPILSRKACKAETSLRRICADAKLVNTQILVRRSKNQKQSVSPSVNPYAGLGQKTRQIPKAPHSFTLSPRERAGVRGKATSHVQYPPHFLSAKPFWRSLQRTRKPSCIKPFC